MTAVIQACDVLNQALPPGTAPLSDDEILADCQKCGDVPLSSCRVTQAKETTYACGKCGNPLLIIGVIKTDGAPRPGRGYRFRDFLVRNVTDLRYLGMLLRRSPAALDAARKR